MTEAEWLSCDDPAPLLGHAIALGTHPRSGVLARDTSRKLRLFACACCRLVWGQLTERQSRRAVEVAEKFADGLATEEERADAEDDAVDPTPNDVRGLNLGMWPCNPDWDRLASGEHYTWQVSESVAEMGVGRAEIAALLREIVGNPFRPVKLPGAKKKCWVCDGKGWRYPGPEADEDEYACAGCGRPAGLYGHYKDGKMGCPREDCPRCKGSGEVAGACAWLTPTALAVAQAAYDDRPVRACPVCRGRRKLLYHVDHPRDYRFTEAGDEVDISRMEHKTEERKCYRCRGSGYLHGTLDPVRLMVLADALEEAGCTGDDLLAHLRSPDPHVLGCWALDLVLGRE